MFSEEKNVVTIFHLWLGFSANFWESLLRSEIIFELFTRSFTLSFNTHLLNI